MNIEATGLIAISASIAMGLAALGTGWAQASIGSSAMGTLAEKPEEFTKLLIFLALPETIVILGFVIAIMLTGKI